MCDLVNHLKVISISLLPPWIMWWTSTETVLERQVHFASVRTGIDDIDQVIDLVLGVDDNAIRNALVFSLIECTHEDGLGGPPKCREGEEEGAEVEVLPILGPEGHFFRQDEIEDWRGIGVVGLYAAYEVSTRAFSDENYPAGEFAAISLHPCRTASFHRPG
jgi:hypothetical protein